jgi:tetratricopeptide (TPR) repeat protein
MQISRKQTVLFISLAVLVALAAYGVWRYWDRLTDPYYGLTTTIDIQMEESTRTLIRQRLATAEASIAAAEKSGQTPDEALYSVVAESRYFLGDLIGAREAYEGILDRDPNAYKTWNSYANILERMGDLEHAENAYSTALFLSKTEEYYRDYIEFLQAYYPERGADIKRTIDEAYTNLGQTTWTMVTLGSWYFSQGDCEQGKEHYTVAKNLGAENSETIAKELQEKYTACKNAE